MSNRVLLIDDEVLLTVNLQDFLEDFDYTVYTANNGEQGLICIKEHNPDIVIVDLSMPVMDGYEFTKRATRSNPDLPIIVLSGVGLIDDAMRAVREGAWDFISKPLTDMQIVLYSIDKCKEKADLIRENKKYQHHLEELVRERTVQLQKTKKQIINSLGKAAEFKDNVTGLHVVRVAQMSFILAQSMALDQKFCQIIKEAAPMHDVGKIGIHDSVLLKKGTLDEQEWEHMKQHTKFGCSILSPEDGINTETTFSPESLLRSDEGNDILTVARRIALFHHETWDGKGYPFGLCKERIPVEARIVSLVDVYDAVSSKRPYKDAFQEEKCQEIIENGRGTQFDPSVVEAFFNSLDAIIQIKHQFFDN